MHEFLVRVGAEAPNLLDFRKNVEDQIGPKLTENHWSAIQGVFSSYWLKAQLGRDQDILQLKALQNLLWDMTNRNAFRATLGHTAARQHLDAIAAAIEDLQVQIYPIEEVVEESDLGKKNQKRGYLSPHEGRNPLILEIARIVSDVIVVKSPKVMDSQGYCDFQRLILALNLLYEQSPEAFSRALNRVLESPSVVT